MLQIFKNGNGSTILRVKIRDSSSARGAGLKGLTGSSTGLIISTIADNEASATIYTQAATHIQTIAALGTFSAPSASNCRFGEVDSTNHPGVYELQIADARFAVSSAKSLLISISGPAALNIVETDALVPLWTLDPYSTGGTVGANMTQVNGHNVTDTANGVLDVNAKNIGGTSQTGLDLAANWTAARAAHLDADISSRMATYTQPTGFLAATFPSGTIANTTNITAGTITTTTTATNLTNLPSIPANWLTAAGINATALNGKGDWNTTSHFDTILGTPAVSVSADLAEIEGETDTLLTNVAAIPTNPYTGTPPTTAQIATAIWQDATASDFTTAHSIGKTLYIDNAIPGAASGLAIVGSAMAVTGDLTATMKTSVQSACDAAVTANTVIIEIATDTDTLIAGVTVSSAGLNGVLVDGKALPAALQIIAAICAGKISGAGTGTETFVGLDGATTRAVVTVDASGNRTGVTYP